MELYTVDIMLFYNCCESTAYDRIREIKKYYNLNSKRILKIHLAKYNKITLNELSEVLNYLKSTNK